MKVCWWFETYKKRFVICDPESQSLELETPVSIDAKTTLFCIVRYVSHNNLVNEATFSYYEKFGDFSRDINRGGLKVPGDTACQWTIYSYIFFSRNC